MRLQTWLGAVALFACSTQSAWGWCDPQTDYSVREEFRRSDIVALVKAEKVTWLDERRRPTKLPGKPTLGSIAGGFDPYIGAYYRVRVVKLFKGPKVRSMEIFSENTEARTPLLIGPTLLLYITRTRRGDEYRRAGDLTVDYCGNSARASKAGRQIRLLNRLGSRR